MFEKELQYFVNNQEKFVKKHQNKFLVIMDNKIIGVYNTPLEAYLETKKSYEPGTFMIQRCVPGPQAYTITISTQGLIK